LPKAIKHYYKNMFKNIHICNIFFKIINRKTRKRPQICERDFKTSYECKYGFYIFFRRRNYLRIHILLLAVNLSSIFIHVLELFLQSFLHKKRQKLDENTF
jgi:hypothetical protein